MPFDLKTYARGHRYRVRNLHDGQPVPPARPKRKTGRAVAFGGAEDRCDAIVCRLGYVCAEGDGIGWVLLTGSVRTVTNRLGRLREIPGVVVQQEGNWEAAGVAPVAAVGAILDVLEVYRRRPPSPGASADRMAAIRPRTGCVGAAQTGPKTTQPVVEGGP